jgi:hypothetical protein
MYIYIYIHIYIPSRDEFSSFAQINSHPGSLRVVGVVRHDRPCVKIGAILMVKLV